MKKLLIAASVLAAVSATPAFAETANTTVYAQVAPICTISAPGVTAINLNGQTQIGDVTAQCNNAAGFTATISSLHSGNLADQDNAANATLYPYTLNIGGFGAVPLTSAGTQVTSNQLGGSGALINSTSYPLTVDVAAPSGPAYAGTYQDTVSFTLTAN